MKVEALRVGAIIGMTKPTDGKTTMRAFGRGRAYTDKDQTQQIVGIMRLKATDYQDINESVPDNFMAQEAKYYCEEMTPYADWSGVIEVPDRDTGKVYAYQYGYLELKEEEKLSDEKLGKELTDDKELIDSLQWEDIPVYLIKTLSSEDSDRCSVVFGSCRWMFQDRLLVFRLSNLYGEPREAEEKDCFMYKSEGDKTFEAIVNNHVNKNPLTQAIMCGDQIYADDIGSQKKVPLLPIKLPIDLLSPTVERHDFLRQYRVAFSRPHIKEMMARIPTFMILDDHEVENDCPNGVSSKKENIYTTDKFHNAMDAYQIYQHSHNPGEQNPENVNDKPPYWYQYRDGCADFFVMEVRTDNRQSSDKSKNIVSEDQLEELIDWLIDPKRQDRVKCVVSSTAFFPSKKKKEEENWTFSWEQRNRLLKTIATGKKISKDETEPANQSDAKPIKKVVFLSGDFHRSFTTVLESKNEQDDGKVIQVISSPFFRPELSTEIGSPESNLESDSKDETLLTILPSAVKDLASEAKSILEFVTKEMLLERLMRIFHGRRDPKDFNLNEEIRNPQGLEDYYNLKLKTPSKFIDENNFTRVDIDPDRLTVSVYDQDGEEIDRTRFDFEKKTKKITLESLTCENITSVVTNTGIGVLNRAIDRTANAVIRDVTDECRLDILVDGKPEKPLSKNMKAGDEWSLNEQEEQTTFEYNYRVIIRLFEEDRDAVTSKVTGLVSSSSKGLFYSEKLLGELDILMGDEEKEKLTSYTFTNKKGKDTFKYTLKYKIEDAE